MRYRTDIAQHAGEFDAYCEMLRNNEIESYLEVGSKFGGSLWKAATSLPAGSKIVSVDLPNGTRAWGESSRSLVDCVAELNALGYDARVIWGDSQDKEIIRQVQHYAPFHAVMIDADHRRAGVEADFENYGPMASHMVAFHDIGWRRAPEWKGVRIDVPQFWNSIKSDYLHREIKLCPTGKNNGIGVLWKP